MSLKVYQSKNPKYAGHTAGPWNWEMGQGVITAEWNGFPWHVATVDMSELGWHENDQSKARENGRNAALIADAPFLACEVERLRELCGELVGALEEIVNNAVKNYEGSMDIYPEAISVARSALAKAKGGDE